MSDNIKVVVKVRPLISREIEDNLSFQWKVINNTLYQLDANGKETGVHFTFDKVYDVNTKTADVYEDVAKPIVEAAIAGFNGTIFAYGQTSSGKTYTMSGTETSPGIIQMAVLNLFEKIKCIPDRDFLVRVSYIEIYNETLKDLLKCDNDKIKIRDTLQGVKLEATEKFTSSPEEVLDIMREGEANRHTGATFMNEESSRSHSIFQITIESREHTEGEETAGCVNVSQLNLVDLAGSERAGQTGATGKRFKEGTHINKSLSVLALVIKQLSEGPHRHANYRDSKLTRILQNSLGGNAKTSIICAVTPAAIEETISTLQFANRAKAVKNKPEVNAVATDATKLQDLTKQLSKLQSELATKNNIEQDNRLLIIKIENLQKMILNGFGQSSIDIGGARRKTWCAPRRMTISTTSLRSVDEHEEAVVQRFCTPSLKYNPLAFPTPREFQAIQRPSQLPSVSEERVMTTPPPKDKKVNFSDEIIELDSDEDTASNASHCSPYHKCYNASKTPPCVLRKKAKTAEKDLKDIVELTEREKVYNPDVVEYMKKLEQSITKIAILEDEIKSISDKNIEKDTEMRLLKDMIELTKNEVQTYSAAKAELEARCKEYSTKLTDLEVSYETLKTKAKLREEELLSLISEQTGSKNLKENCKSLSRTIDNFMDMSKDISLVSDNDSSIDSSNNEPSGQLQRLVDEMRADVTAKNEAIAKLESDILQQKRTIESLESTCTVLRDEINKTNSALKHTKEENSNLKLSMETLSSTINTQKQNLESANNDIQSYSMVIKELQAKLVDKDHDSVEINIEDTSLEKMLHNEEKLISNNENMRNLARSFKIALESRDKEIEQLKSNSTSAIDMYTKQLDEKENEIIQLLEEVNKHKEQIQENIDRINKLIEENRGLVKNTNDLSEKLLNSETQNSELEKRVAELEKVNKDYTSQLHEFIEGANKSKEQIQDNIDVINKLVDNNKNLVNSTDDLTEKLSNAEKQSSELEKHVLKLKKDNEEYSLQLQKFERETNSSKQQIQENMNLINKLIEDNKDLVKNTDELSEKLLNAEKRSTEFEKRVLELEKENKEYIHQLSEFNQNHDKLLKNLSDFKHDLHMSEKEKETLYELQHEIHRKDHLIDELKSEISAKDSLRNSLSNEHIESQDYLCKWKTTVIKLKQLLSAHIFEANGEEEFTDDASSFDELCDQLNFVENAIKEVVSQKEQVLVNNDCLRQEIKELQSRIKSLAENEIHNEKNEQAIEVARNLKDIQRELFELNTQNAELIEKLQQTEENHDVMKQRIIEKEQIISSLKDEENNLLLELEKVSQLNMVSRNEIEKLQAQLRNAQAGFDEISKSYLDQVTDLKRDLTKKDSLIDKLNTEFNTLSKTLEETICNRDQLLDSIYKVAINVLQKIDLQNEECQSQNTVQGNVYSDIINILDRATNDIILLKSSSEVNNCQEIKETIELLDTLKEQNHQLINKLTYTENENARLVSELEQIKFENKNICNDLLKSDEMLKQLQVELQEKLRIIENITSQINEWRKDNSPTLDNTKQHTLELQASNSDLKSRQNSVKRSLSIIINEPFAVGSGFTDLENDQRQTIRRSLTNLLVEPGHYSPQSLLTLCCNRIIEAIQPSELNSTSSCDTNFEAANAGTQTDACDYEILLTEKKITVDENLELKAEIECLRSINTSLLIEQEEIRKELKLLMKPAQELQKKISSHKTNLSTLTATTYAENKLLKSQVKVLQHHNNRIYNVCQRDLPSFKKSLCELSSILKKTSLANRLDVNTKRFSLPEVLDRNTSAFKDESTLDGDLLMLDTNVTIASVDNTLLAQDQTCLDGTHLYLETEMNTDVIETIDPNILHTQLQMLSIENEKLTEKLTSLIIENKTLHEKIDKLTENKKSDVGKIDVQTSTVNLQCSLNESNQESTIIYHTADKLCDNCKNINIPLTCGKNTDEINRLINELTEVKLQKTELEKRCNILNNEILANDHLVLKINVLEKDNYKQLNLIEQLTNKLTSKNEQFVKLQEEHDLLSTQVMESIDESDLLRKEVDSLKENNAALGAKCSELEQSIKGKTVSCIRCAQNARTADSTAVVKAELNRSRSDSESSSCCNKLSTLQNELLAGREDCKTISEDVATIKNHLERGELSMTHEMDLDGSMGEPNVFAFPKEFNVASPKPNKFELGAGIQEERLADLYALEKTDCYNYYLEKTGSESNVTGEIRIIEVMKMFHDNLVTKHGNEVENLVNKLKDFEEAKNQLQEKVDAMTSEYSRINDEIKEKENNINSIADTLNQIRSNIHDMKEEICNYDTDKNTLLVTKFKNNVLCILDNDFDLSSVNIFENLIDKVVNKHKNDLVDVMNRYSELQEHLELLTSELSKVTDNLNEMKCQLNEKEKEYNLLKAQKEKVHEITSAVTRDIVQREQDLCKILSNGYQKLIEHNFLTQNDIDISWPVDKQIPILIEKIIDLSNRCDLVLQEKHTLTIEVTKSKTVLEEKDQEVEYLKSQVEQLRELCKNATNELLIKNENLETLKSLHEQLDEIYHKKVEENDANTKTIDNMTEEINLLKASVNEKDNLLKTLELQKQNSKEFDTKSKIAELMESINSLQHENKNLKSVNDMITHESEQNALQLAQADETIKKNKTELDKLTTEILTLNQSLKESMNVIDNLKVEAKSLLEQNVAVKKKFDEANDLCSQLKLNMKTHEKSTEIQCKIISRLKQEKETIVASNSIKEKELTETLEQCDALRQEIRQLAEDMNKYKQEAHEMKEAKESLERRLAELEAAGARGSPAAGDARRRRPSLLDSKRLFGDDKLEPDQKKMEAFFSTHEKPDDLFMDVDDQSNRSTPARNRRSDSFQSRNGEGEESSRPSSAMSRRQRRQSLYDQHRGTHVDTQEQLNPLSEITAASIGDHDSVASLKERLRLYQQELEELKERYREVDEECEICAEYLRERDQQCMRLTVENKDLQQQIEKLNEKLQNASTIRSEKEAQRSFVNASVNTDEDWANLHSVVVDRMSFDREVERNKALQRAADELRYKNNELKAALAKARGKAERALANKANLQELEATKLELESCKRELEECKERCKELDEECEICGQYLRERDEQLCRLKEARDALEAKLEAMEQKEAGSKLQAVRKKRQSMHDQNRDSAEHSTDASTHTGDLPSETDSSKLTSELMQNNEILQLKMALETMSRQKQALELQLRAGAGAGALLPPVYVATGSAIVQNQHLTEVMKENQKLKKMNAKLINICKKRGKPLGESNRENDDPADLG